MLSIVFFLNFITLSPSALFTDFYHLCILRMLFEAIFVLTCFTSGMTSCGSGFGYKIKSSGSYPYYLSMF